MLDIKFVRNNPDVVKQNIKNKFQDEKLPLVDEVIELDQKNRDIKGEVEALRAEKNKNSKQIGACMAQGKKEEAEENFTISFAGDCTLGNYAGQAYDGSFNQEYKRQESDPTYFLKKVKEVFEKDDLTVVNLEGPLTTASNHLEK